MKNLQIQSVLAAGFSAVTVMMIASPAGAANITYDFTVNPTFGPLLGESYSGSFTFDDANLIGFGEEFISVDSFSFSFLGVDYTEADGAPNEPEVAFFDGSFLGLGFNEDDFSFVPGFFDLSEAFFTYDLASGSGDGTSMRCSSPEGQRSERQRRYPPPLARGRPGGRSARELRHQEARQEGCFALHEKSAEDPRAGQLNHHRWLAFVQSRYDRARKPREAGDRSLGEQPSGELTLTRPTKRAGDAALQEDEVSSQVRLRSRQRSQPVRCAALRISSDRQLSDRQTYKTSRSAALAEWQSLLA